MADFSVSRLEWEVSLITKGQILPQIPSVIDETLLPDGERGLHSAFSRQSKIINVQGQTPDLLTYIGWVYK